MVRVLAGSIAPTKVCGLFLHSFLLLHDEGSVSRGSEAWLGREKGDNPPVPSIPVTITIERKVVGETDPLQVGPDQLATVLVVHSAGFRLRVQVALLRTVSHPPAVYI